MDNTGYVVKDFGLGVLIRRINVNPYANAGAVFTVEFDNRSIGASYWTNAYNQAMREYQRRYDALHPRPSILDEMRAWSEQRRLMRLGQESEAHTL